MPSVAAYTATRRIHNPTNLTRAHDGGRRTPRNLKTGADEAASESKEGQSLFRFGHFSLGSAGQLDQGADAEPGAADRRVGLLVVVGGAGDVEVRPGHVAHEPLEELGGGD